MARALKRLPAIGTALRRLSAPRQGNTLEENARLFALLNIAMADAAICAWDAKYTFDFWRPVTAIAFAEPELNWMPLHRDAAVPRVHFWP